MTFSGANDSLSTNSKPKVEVVEEADDSNLLEFMSVAQSFVDIGDDDAPVQRAMSAFSDIFIDASDGEVMSSFREMVSEAVDDSEAFEAIKPQLKLANITEPRMMLP